MSLDKFISPYIASQFPRLYREEGPAFIQFLKAYYQWMEEVGGTLYDAKRLPDYRDIDTTLDEFLVHFKNKYMVGLPEDALGDKRTLQKHIKEIYSSKGTAQGLELLFRLLYNESSEVYLPGDDILRPSDGVWVKPVYLEVSVNPFNVLLIGEQITGRESLATAIVEDFQIRYINKRQINVLFLSNVRGDFQTNEIILSDVVSDPLLSPSIIGSMSEILINESGFGFSVGDVLEVGGGSGLLGKAVVSAVSSRSGAVSFTIIAGGSGYANNNAFAPNVITVTPVDLDNPGIGADFEVGEISNTEVIATAVDIIAPYANTQLNSPDYQFPTNVGAENINTPLDQAFNVQNITVGTIKTLRAINPGAGYNGPVIVTVDSPVISGLMIQDAVNGNYKGNNAIIDGKAAAGNGAIDTVKILNSGVGYANGDIITLNNEDVPFVAGGTVILSKQGYGEGYWKDTRSFLNSDKYIQDSFYYQEYSYETRLSVAFNYYSDLLKKLWHPAGTQGFGKVVVSAEADSLSDAVEVEIIATRITEYMTQFSTFVLTTGATSTQFVTQYATQYPTNNPTETSRTTQADYLVNQPNLIINGAFNFNTDNWVARGDTVFSWSNNAGRIERGATDASAVQSVSTSNGATYQLDLTFSNSNAASVTVYACKSNSTSNAEVLATSTKTGAANTFQITFDGVGNTSFIILEVGGTTGSLADFDDVQLRSVPTLTQQTNFVTNFARDTAVDGGSRLTTFNTSTVFNTVFNTQYATVFDAFPEKNTSFITQVLTGSSVATNRATDRATVTAFDTTFDTTLATNRLTATSLVTSFATVVDTTTAFETAFATSYSTNRSTTTSFNTAYDTIFGTNRATTTAFNTNRATILATNRATTTAFNTNRLTNTLFDTSRSTITSRATNRATTTTFDTNRATNRVTQTSRTTTFSTAFNTTYNTVFNTAYNTTYNSVFNTTYNTEYESIYLTSTGGVEQNTTGIIIRQTTRATNISTIRATNRSTNFSTTKGTSRDTSRTTGFATTTAYVTAFATNFATTTAFVTSFATTTTFATNIDTTTTFATNRATTTAFNTTFDTTFETNFATTTAFDTNFATNRITSASTSTIFDTTIDTVFATNRLTGTSFLTSRATTFDTLTAFNTSFQTTGVTNRSTSTAYDTAFMTGTVKLTDILTSRVTNTTVPTVTTTLTNRTTNLATNRATLTSRTTLLATVISTAVQRDTSRTTIFVAYPTSFVTAYLTGTDVLTDYQTARATDNSTSTTYDTAYPTERLTAVLTQTDVAE